MNTRLASRFGRSRFSTVLSYLVLCVYLAVSDTATAADTSGSTATLSGTVAGARPFKAAKVRAVNLDKDIHYMVFTSKGHYQAVGLLPGKYQVSVQKDGFSTAPRTIEVRAGEDVKLDFKLQEGGEPEFLTQPAYPFADWQHVSEYLTYDALYPAGPGRTLVENSCLNCHRNKSYLPAHPRDAAAWLATVNDHQDPASGKKSLGAPPFALVPSDALSLAERDKVVAYLAANFGPGPKRGVRIEADSIPMDEAVLAKAMYVEYYLPLDPKLDPGHNRRGAQDAHLDRNGNVWWTENTIPSRVGMLNPRTGEFKDYPLPSPRAYPHGLTVDANNDVWWDERDVSYIGRLEQATGKMIHYSSDPDGLIPSGPWWAHTPVADSKQNIWSSYIGTNLIGKWDRNAGRVTHLWGFPTTYGLAYGMAVDKNDNIWVAETGGCKVAKFDPVTERFTEYASREPHCEIFRVGIDTQGIVWYATRLGTLGKIDPKTGEVTERRIPFNSVPYDVQGDPQGNVWFSDAGFNGALVRFDPRTEKYSYYPSPQVTDIPRLDISDEGAVWYCPRSAAHGAVGVFYYDVTKFKELRSR